MADAGEHTQIVKDFMAALIDGDWAKTSGYLHEDLTIEEASCMPYPGLWRGIDGYKALGDRFKEVWIRDWTHGEYFYAESEGVVVKQNIFKATARATGIEVEMPIVEFIYFEDDKIRAIVPYYWDTAAIAAATRASAAVVQSNH